MYLGCTVSHHALDVLLDKGLTQDGGGARARAHWHTEQAAQQIPHVPAIPCAHWRIPAIHRYIPQAVLGGSTSQGE